MTSQKDRAAEVLAALHPKPPSKARVARLRSETPDLADLVTEGVLSFNEAEVAADVRRRKAAYAERERLAEERKPKPGDAWRRLGLPVPETPEDWRTYARYILGHSPGLADLVAKHGLFLDAVKQVNEWCPFPCDRHPPLSEDQILAKAKELLEKAGAGDQCQ